VMVARLSFRDSNSVNHALMDVIFLTPKKFSGKI